MTHFLSTVFPAVLNMSLTAIPVILAVLLARLLLKRVPKIFSYLLWAVVLFRLLCPVSLTASFSLLGALDAPSAPSANKVTTVEYVQPILAELEPMKPVPAAPETAAPTAPTVPTAPVVPTESPVPEKAPVTVMDVLPWVWLTGFLGMAAYSALSLLRLHRKLIGSVRLRENIYLSDYAETAFVAGFLRPKIYLPSTIQESEQRYILLHEQHHIRRGDPVWKLLAFLALAIHWFNPLVWLSFVLAARDMEMSCDEAVVRKLGEGIRADYSQSLLNLAAGHRLIVGPLAFGEGDTRSRVTNVLSWKRPRTWVVLLAAVGCIGVVAACGANPLRPAEGQYASMEEYVAEQIEKMPPTLNLITMDSETSGELKEVTYQTITSKLDFLEEAGRQVDLDPKGELSVWRYSVLTQVDLEGRDPDLVGRVDGCYTDEEGFYHGAGQQIAVARTYADGSMDVLYDELDVDGTGFSHAHFNFNEALYDWYVKENHLESELPLFVKDWQAQINYPEDATRSEYLVHRIDGDGWYFYAPIHVWRRSFAYGKIEWTSSYGTGSHLVVDSFTQSMEDEQWGCKKQGYSPVEGSFQDPNWYIWKKETPELNSFYYFHEKADGGTWRICIEWNPQIIAERWFPDVKIEPQVLQLMAESFVTDDSVQHPVGLELALETVRQAEQWENLPCDVVQQEGSGQLEAGQEEGAYYDSDQPPRLVPNRLVQNAVEQLKKTAG